MANNITPRSYAYHHITRSTYRRLLLPRVPCGNTRELDLARVPGTGSQVGDVERRRHLQQAKGTARALMTVFRSDEVGLPMRVFKYRKLRYTGCVLMNKKLHKTEQVRAG